MLWTRILLIAACIGISVLLFTFPRSVVENERGLSSTMNGDLQTGGHGPVDETLQRAMNTLRAQIDNNPQDRNYPIFADSLASLYARAGRYDSAATYKEKSAAFIDSPEKWLSAGEAWYQAFTFSMDESKRKDFIQRSQDILRNILVKDPGNNAAKVKLAVTLMTTETPMQGINLLREVIADDPKNEEALLKMGAFSIQSRQFEKAFDWLRRLEKVNPENVEGQLLLGVAFAETGDKEKAKTQFERTRKLTNDPAVQQQLDQYMKDLK